MRIPKILIPTLILLAPAAVTATAATGPAIRTNQACYLPGQSVTVTGRGFAPGQMYDVAVDGQDFGTSTTNASGGFSVPFTPAGVPAGYAQFDYSLTANDGISEANASFTVTRKTGGRVIIIGSGPASSVRAQYQIWGFALKHNKPQTFVPGRPTPVLYVHYVNPRGRLIMTIPLGRESAPCGYVKSPTRPLFGFPPGPGSWLLQVDANVTYSKHPKGQVVKLGLRVR